jgi:N-acyl-phosphatidylethanolamine-hydrolysing phospholipase D
MGQEIARLPEHHRPEGGFRNPWPSAKTHGILDFLKWTVVERRGSPRRPDPDHGAFARVAPQFIVPRADPETFTLTWVGHTSFLIQMSGLNILLDPIWSERASPVRFAGPRRWVPPGVDFDRLPPIDAVILSHDHYDHLDAATISRLVERYPAAVWYSPLKVGEFLRRRGAREVVERDWWEETTIRSLHLMCVPAQHFSGRTIRKRDKTLWCGWVLRSPERTLFFAGDTGLHPEFSSISARCGPIDVAILPIGAYEPRWFMGSVHMNPDDCMKAVAQLKTAHGGGRRLVVAAAHWGTFKLTDEPMDEPPARMRHEWQTSGLDSKDLWIMRHGETRVLR